jgi:transcriptional regulator with XRE-family HTH domain
MSTFREHLAEQLKDPQFRELYEALQANAQVILMRHLRGLTQSELAERAGMKQPYVSRVERFATEPSIRSMRRLAGALDSRLDVRLIPREVAEAWDELGEWLTALVFYRDADCRAKIAQVLGSLPPVEGADRVTCDGTAEGEEADPVRRPAHAA